MHMAKVKATKDKKTGKIKIKAKNKGKLSKKLGIPEDKNIPTKVLDKAKEGATKATKKMITFAENAKKWKK